MKDVFCYKRKERERESKVSKDQRVKRDSILLPATKFLLNLLLQYKIIILELPVFPVLYCHAVIYKIVWCVVWMFASPEL